MTTSKFITFIIIIISVLNLQAQKKVYLSSSESIYLADLETCSAQLISNIPGQNWIDMALNPITDTLYGVNYDNLYWIDKNNGTAHLIGPTPSFNALTFAKDGTLYGASILGANLHVINTQTAASTSLGAMPFGSSGDLAFYNDTLFLLGYNSSPIQHQLVKLDLNNLYNSSSLGFLNQEYPYGLTTIGCPKHMYGFFSSDVYLFNTFYPITTQLVCQNIIPEKITGAAGINEDMGDVGFIGLGADQTLCVGETLLLSLPSSNINYTWSNGDTGNSLFVDSAGVYWVDMQHDTCVVRDSIKVDYITTPDIEPLQDSALCEGQPFYIDLNSYNLNSNWYKDSIKVLVSDTTHLYNINITGGPCQIDFKDTVKVDYYKHPQYTWSGLYDICMGDTLELNVWNRGATYLWQDNSTSSYYTITQQGNYSVEIRNFCGAILQEINVRENCNCLQDIPNAFSPNGDGHNEIFRPIIECSLESIRFRVFNRWGQTIYDGQDAMIGWDGYFQGVLCPQDDYIYLLEYKESNGIERVIKGQFTLIN